MYTRGRERRTGRSGLGLALSRNEICASGMYRKVGRRVRSSASALGELRRPGSNGLTRRRCPCCEEPCIGPQAYIVVSCLRDRGLGSRCFGEGVVHQAPWWVGCSSFLIATLTAAFTYNHAMAWMDRGVIGPSAAQPSARRLCICWTASSEFLSRQLVRSLVVIRISRGRAWGAACGVEAERASSNLRWQGLRGIKVG